MWGLLLYPFVVFLMALLFGCSIFCIIAILSALDYAKVRRPRLFEETPLSVLKPLSGVDEGLEENLRSFFAQDYRAYEILFAVADEADPAVAVVRKLAAEYPKISSQILIVGPSPYANAKVFSLAQMTEAARNSVLVMSDSDIRVRPDMLQTIGAEFQDTHLGVASCPYRAVAGESIWSQLEALDMNTLFFSGVLAARTLEGVKFALGPTLIARREAIAAAGGWEFLKDFLAEDFVIGNKAAAEGWTVILSSYIVEHRIGSESFAKTAEHRLRWNRSTRRSRPRGYFGQIATNPVPLALFLAIMSPALWPAFCLILVLRMILAFVVSEKVLGDRLDLRKLALIPLQDCLSFYFWVAGFFGKTIVWRNREYELLADGRFEPLE